VHALDGHRDRVACSKPNSNPGHRFARGRLASAHHLLEKRERCEQKRLRLLEGRDAELLRLTFRLRFGFDEGVSEIDRQCRSAALRALSLHLDVLAGLIGPEIDDVLRVESIRLREIARECQGGGVARESLDRHGVFALSGHEFGLPRRLGTERRYAQRYQAKAGE